MTSTNVLEISDMAIDDLCYNYHFEKIIEIKEDINIACKRLFIESPINVTDAKRISHYLNRMYGYE